MRKFLIPLLMASVVMPAAASAKERGGFVGALRERAAQQSGAQSSSANRQDNERTFRVQRQERSSDGEPSRRSGGFERPSGMSGFERRQRIVRPQLPEQPLAIAEPQGDARIDRVERVRDGRPTSNNLVERFRDAAREQQDGRQVGDRRGSHNGWDGRRDGRVETGGTTSRRWNGDWRRDNRYDWRSHRDRNRSLFRIGRYYDPYGWGYRRFSIGFSLSPSYYSSNYWLDDPWMYRLPPAYGPYRWVRYYDDALLVNIYTGQVVDVLNNFFW